MHLSSQLGLKLATYAKCDEYLTCLCISVSVSVSLSVHVSVCVEYECVLGLMHSDFIWLPGKPMKSECNQPMIVIIFARQTRFEPYVCRGKGARGELTKQQ